MVGDGKRHRDKNFTKAEENLLVDLVRKYQHILENKKADAVTWKEKQEGWNRLATEFNSVGIQVPRSISQIQLKYKGLKKQERQKSTAVLLESKKTGGSASGTIPLDEVEKKVKNVIKLSVDELPPEYDCDVIMATPGTSGGSSGKSSSLSNGATNVHLHKDKLLNLQSICMQQEIEINEVRKRTVLIEERKMLLDEEKTKLEIELLKKQLKKFPDEG